MKTVMVFGATGTLGTYFVDELVEKGYNVYAIGCKNVKEDYYKNRGIPYSRVNITIREDFEKLPKDNVDTVVQISGAMPSRMVGYNPQKYIDVNITGTLNVLEYCRNTKVDSFLFTHSHSDVAGYWNTGIYIKPNALRKLNLKGDHAVYIISKNAAVDLIEHYHQEYNLKTFIFRLPTIYSWRPITKMYVNGKSTYLAYRYLIEMAKKSKPIEIWGDPNKAKDIVYVKDFNQMLIKAINCKLSKGFYNVATSVPTTLDEQIKGIIQVFSPKENPSKIIYRPDKPSQTSYLYDISNAKKELGYDPKYYYIDMLIDMKKEMYNNRFDHLKNAKVEI